MRLNSKLNVVIRHEYITIVKQPSFWIALVAVPALILGVVFFNYISERDKGGDIAKAAAQSLKISVIDQSGLIDVKLVTESGATVATPDKTAQLIESVKQGRTNGLIVYPANIEQTSRYQVYADNSEKDTGATVSSIGDSLLQRSVLAPIQSEDLQTIALGNAQSDDVVYRNGKVAPSINDMILPGLFLVMFYIVLVFSVSYALTSVSDEKENRSIEMVLSYVKPQTLILGKLIGVILVTFTQILYFVAIGAAALLIFKLFGNSLSLPIGLSDITFDPTAIFFGLSFLLLGFVFFVGLMATIGAIFPSAKDAGGFSTIFFILPAVPFWLFSTIRNESGSLVTQVLTYLPLTSPTTALIRNTFGTLSIREGLISLVLLAISTVGIILLAGKAFKLGTLEFNSRVSLKNLVRSRG